MVDGYALIAITDDGTKSYCIEHRVFDIRLESLEFDHLEEWLTPNNLKNCLVMVFFKYKSVRSGGWEYVEYEDCFTPVSHVVIQNEYKEFWRGQISIQVTSHGYDDYPSINMTADDEQWADTIIGEWEELYEEEFEVHTNWLRKSKKDRNDDMNVQLLKDILH